MMGIAVCNDMIFATRGFSVIVMGIDGSEQYRWETSQWTGIDIIVDQEDVLLTGDRHIYFYDWYGNVRHSWAAITDRLSANLHIAIKDSIVAVSNQINVVIHDRDTGLILRTLQPVTTEWIPEHIIYLGDNLLVVDSLQSCIYIFDDASEYTIWSPPTLKHVTTIAVHGDRVFTGQPGVITEYAFRSQSVTRQWSSGWPISMFVNNKILFVNDLQRKTMIQFEIG